MFTLTFVTAWLTLVDPVAGPAAVVDAAAAIEVGRDSAAVDLSAVAAMATEPEEESDPVFTSAVATFSIPFGSRSRAVTATSISGRPAPCRHVLRC